MNKSFLLALPAFNQSDDILGVIHEAQMHDVDILVIDDGSTDDTKQKIADVKDVYKMFHKKNLGYGQTLINSFQYAINNKYDFIITMDTDGQHMPAEIPFFIKEAPNYDIVSGSRYLNQRSLREDVPPDRYCINKEITSILNNITGFNLTDSFCGFKAYSVESLKKFALSVPGYGMPLQVWVQAWKYQLKIKEIQVQLIYKDFDKQFSNGLHNPDTRLLYYKSIIDNETEICENKIEKENHRF